MKLLARGKPTHSRPRLPVRRCSGLSAVGFCCCIPSYTALQVSGFLFVLLEPQNCIYESQVCRVRRVSPRKFVIPKKRGCVGSNSISNHTPTCRQVFFPSRLHKYVVQGLDPNPNHSLRHVSLMRRYTYCSTHAAVRPSESLSLPLRSQRPGRRQILWNAYSTTMTATSSRSGSISILHLRLLRKAYQSRWMPPICSGKARALSTELESPSPFAGRAVMKATTICPESHTL
jgi:hypothetical protein